MVSEEPSPSSPRQPLPVTASEYLCDKVYPTLEPALEAMLKAAFPADRPVEEGEEEQGVLEAPLAWLAKYLKERNIENSAKRDQDTWQAALDGVKSGGESYEAVYNKGVAAARSVFWPCSAVIAIKDVVMEQVPATPREPEPKAEGEEEEAAAPAEEEGEEGTEKKVEMKDITVPILRYVATSHPDKRSMEGWVLRYEEQGRSGSVVSSGNTLVVAQAALEEERLHFFCGRTRGAPAAGAYCAVPLKEKDGSVYGVLAMDTLLDGRAIGDGDVARLQQLAAAVDEAREPFAEADREKRRLEEEAAEAARREEEEKQRLEAEAAAAEAGEGEEEGEGGAEEKGN